IGHRRIDCGRHPKSADVWPVRIAADAFGPGKPCRDLWLSPDHALFVNDVLIPVKYLMNDSTIAQIPIDEVVYYHVALTRHDAILAEGLAVESYLDSGDRSEFANGGSVVHLSADFARSGDLNSLLWEARGCAPLVVTGPELIALKQLLRDRQEAALRATPSGDYLPRLSHRPGEMAGNLVA
ncbi:MAG TPA: Hint domain-containing protein, partial [Acetobacteraceae bacterium]